MNAVAKVRVEPILFFLNRYTWFSESTEDVVNRWNQAVREIGQLEAEAKQKVRVASGSLDMELLGQATQALRSLRDAIEDFMNQPWVSELQSAYSADAARLRDEERETYRNIRQQVEEIVQYDSSAVREMSVGDSYPALLHRVVFWSHPVRNARESAEAAERIQASVRRSIEQAFSRLRDYLQLLNIDMVLSNREIFLAAAPITPAA